MNSFSADAWRLDVGDFRRAPVPACACVITDPPYEAEAHTKGRRSLGESVEGKRRVKETPLPFAPIDEAARLEAGRVAARVAERWCVVFCQSEAAMLWRGALESSGEHVYRRTGVWVKPDAQPQFSGDRPGVGYESIVFTHRKGRCAWNGGGRVAVFEHNKRIGGGPNEHPTMKPLALMVELVELFTNPGDLVVDLFAGSGTTGVACMLTGRRFYGVELNLEYAMLAAERLDAACRGVDHRAYRAGQLGLFGGAG